MEMLPPTGWTDVATKQDLAQLGATRRLELTAQIADGQRRRDPVDGRHHDRDASVVTTAVATAIARLDLRDVVQCPVGTGQWTVAWDDGRVRIEAGDRVAMAVEDLVALGEQVDDLDIRATGPDSVAIRTGDDSWSSHRRGGRLAEPGRRSRARGRSGPDRRRQQAQPRGPRPPDRRRTELVRPAGRRAPRPRVAHVRHPVRHRTSTRPTTPPRPRSAPTGRSAGRAGVSYAAALLLAPDDPPTMRGVAREVGHVTAGDQQRGEAARRPGARRRRARPRSPSCSGRSPTCGDR